MARTFSGATKKVGMSVKGGLEIRVGETASFQDAIIKLDTVNTAPTTTAAENYIYVGSDRSLRFNNGTTVTTIGAAGSVAVGTWDAIYAGDQTLNVSGTTFTIDKSAGNQDVLTVTNTGAGSGDCIQITNVGTGNDIEGTSDTWHFTNVGDMTANMAVFAGDAGSNSITLTAGDVLVSDGSITVTNDQDNAATLSLTNNTATTASVFVFAGSGAFTGSTTTSFMTITPSGLTTGTAVYLPVAGLTEGRALHIVANAVTTGVVSSVTSSATAIATTGRLLRIDHTGISSTTGILSEFASAAQDETEIVKITASSTLLLGKVLNLSASSMTTGSCLVASDLDALTTGIGVHVASAATAITGAGRLLYVNHTGATSTSGILAELTTSATDETILLRLNTAAMIDGIALNIIGTTGMTTGSLIRATSSTAGAVATNGVYSFLGTGAFTSGASTVGLFHVAGAATVSGTIMSILGGAQTSGIALNITDPSTGMTSGSLLRVITATTGAVATNGVVSLQASGDYTSTSNQGFVGVLANTTTAGTAVSISGTSLTTGVGLYMANGTSAMTSGSLIRVVASGTGTVATNGIVSIRHAGIFTSTSNTGVLDVRASAMVGTLANGTLVNFMTTAAAQVDTTVLNVENSGFTTGYTGSMLRISSPTTTGACKVVDLLADGITSGGTAMDISTDALTTGIALNIANSGGAMTSGSLLRVTAQGTGAIATNGIVSFTHTGAFTSTSAVNGGFVEIKANDTTSGTVLNLVADALTDGIGVQLSNATSAITTGSLLRVTGSGVGTLATNGLVSITHGGVFASTSNAGVLDVAATATTAGTVVHITSTAAAQTTAQLLNVTASGYTTGYTGNVVQFTGVSTTGAGNVLSVVSANSTDGTGVLITANSLTTGVGLRVTSSGTITSAGQGLVNIVGTGITTGDGLKIDLTEGTLTTGNYLNCYDDTGATSVFRIAEDGATTIGGAALGTAALTISAGDIVLTSGNLNVSGRFITSGTETIAAGGTSTALSLTVSVHYIDADAGGDTFTLADGIAGQITTILLTSSTGTATITPANLAGGTSVTLNADGDSVVLQFMDTEWFILGGNSYAVV